MIRTEGHTAHRELFRDAFSGMLIVGSHVMLDRAPYRPIRVGPRFLGMRLANWLLDAAQCAVVAWLLWPKGAMESAAPSEYGVEQPRPDQSFLNERT